MGWPLSVSFVGVKFDELRLGISVGAPLEGELEEKHKSFNQFVSGNIQHALFRDWPDQF
jgi:hypothetical protein